MTILSQKFIDSINSRLSENKRVRRSLPIFGRSNIDRQLPFLCIYRHPVGADDIGTSRLVTAQASYMTSSGDRRISKNIKEVVRNVIETLSKEFGAFLILELWASEDNDEDTNVEFYERNSHFKIITLKNNPLLKTIESLRDHLEKTKIEKTTPEVEIVYKNKVCPPDLQPIFSAKEAANLNFHLIGLEISPLYRDPKTGTLFPLVRRRYIRLVTRILHQAFFTYAHTQTTHHHPHYHALGKNALVKTVWEFDRKIAEISKSFDFLWYVTPIHSESSWNEFKRKEFQSAPVFQYRPQIICPAILKRNLWNIPIEKLEDQTIGQLFREKRQELDVQISMLENIESKRFLYGSMQLYGNISSELFENASDLLERIPPRSRESSNRQYLDAQQFAELAREEILYYRKNYREMNATVEVRDNLTGLMVLKGHLKLSSFLKIPKSRVESSS